MLPPLHALAPMQQQAASGGAAFLQAPPMGPPAGMQPQPVHYMQPAHGMAYASPAGICCLLFRCFCVNNMVLAAC